MIKDRFIDNLGDLAPCGIVAWVECAITVSADDAVVVRGLDILVKRMAARYVDESRGGWYVDSPPLRKHHYLAQLPPRHVVARTKRPIGVPGNDAVVVGGLNILVEGVVDRYVSK